MVTSATAKQAVAEPRVLTKYRMPTDRPTFPESLTNCETSSGSVAPMSMVGTITSVKEDRFVEERIKQGIADQKARGLGHAIDVSVPVEERAARLKEKLRKRLKEQAEKNGGLSQFGTYLDFWSR